MDKEVYYGKTTVQSILVNKEISKLYIQKGTNQKEIMEIISFYGRKIISREVKKISNSNLPTFENNIKKYNLI